MNAFGIAVDASGTIYCGVPVASAIQAYESSGRFLWSSRIDAAGGLFRLRDRLGGGVEVATVRNRYLYEIAPTGEVLSRREAPGDYEALGSANELETTTASGGRLRLTRGAIVRVAPDGTTDVVVRPPWSLFALELPIAAALLFGFGVLWGTLAVFWRPSIRSGLTRLARIRWGQVRG